MTDDDARNPEGAEDSADPPEEEPAPRGKEDEEKGKARAEELRHMIERLRGGERPAHEGESPREAVHRRMRELAEEDAKAASDDKGATEAQDKGGRAAEGETEGETEGEGETQGEPRDDQ